MSDSIMQKLDEMQARCDAATEGPWEIYDDGWDIGVCTAGDGTPGIAYVAERLRQGRDEGESDARFIAMSRTDMPKLIDALRAVLIGHRPVTYSFSWTEGVQMHEVCPTCYDKAGVHECGCWREEDEDDHQCAVCSMPEVKGGKVSWPCMTVTTIQTALGVES